MKKTADPEQLLAQGLSDLQLDRALARPLSRYAEELRRWNRAYNLTAIRDPAEVVTRHLLDCLSLVPAIESAGIKAQPMLDVGSGAGLPGLILAIARPEWSIDVLDSNGKKARFLRHVQRSMGLQKVRVIESRAETYVPDARYAAVTSRAFASLDKFFVGTRHLLAEDGRWLAMRGHVDENDGALLAPDVAIDQVIPLHVPGLDEARHLVIASPRILGTSPLPK